MDESVSTNEHTLDKEVQAPVDVKKIPLNELVASLKRSTWGARMLVLSSLFLYVALIFGFGSLSAKSEASTMPVPDSTQSAPVERQFSDELQSGLDPLVQEEVEALLEEKEEIMRRRKELVRAYRQLSEGLGLTDSLRLLYANRADSLQLIFGDPFAPAQTHTLSEGWNMIGYNGIREMRLDEAFEGFNDSLFIVKDVNGHIYYPEFGIDQIGVLQPGSAYRVHLSKDTVLVLPR